MKYLHETKAKRINGLTIAERDRIDMMISGMSREFQERALMNFEPDLLLKEVKRRHDIELEAINEIDRVYLKYSNKPYNIVSMRKKLDEYKKAIESIKK